jgi:hypothetical protein
MEFTVLGWPVDEPRLRLDYRRFSYAGKFVTGKTGIAVVRGTPPDQHATPADDSLPPLPDNLSESEFDREILAAVAFNVDRTDSQTLWLRYLTVRDDLRGSGLQLGPRLAAFVTTRAAEHGYDHIRIAVNNVFSYQALYKAGFAYTGRETGISELVLERPAANRAAVSTATYQQGLDQFRQREGLSTVERDFLADHETADPPGLIEIDNPAEPTETVDSGVSNSQPPSE